MSLTLAQSHRGLSSKLIDPDFAGWRELKPVKIVLRRWAVVEGKIQRDSLSLFVKGYWLGGMLILHLSWADQKTICLQQESDFLTLVLWNIRFSQRRNHRVPVWVKRATRLKSGGGRQMLTNRTRHQIKGPPAVAGDVGPVPQENTSAHDDA